MNNFMKKGADAYMLKKMTAQDWTKRPTLQELNREIVKRSLSK